MYTYRQLILVQQQPLLALKRVSLVALLIARIWTVGYTCVLLNPFLDSFLFLTIFNLFSILYDSYVTCDFKCHVMF